jgi:hypothetical protein
MAKFVLAYRGGKMAESEAEIEAQMAAWGAWFGTLGSKIADMGAPFGERTSLGTTPTDVLSGYSIVEVGSIAEAKGAAEGCPVLTSGGSVDVYEAMSMDGATA